MIDDTNQDELIEQYLQGELSGDQLSQFEKRFASDDELRKEVALQKALIKNIKAAGRDQWAQKLQAMHHETVTPFDNEENKTAQKISLSPVRNLYQKKYLLAAAGIAVIISSTVFFLNKKNSLDTNSIFIAYYQPFPDLEQKTRALRTEALSVKQQAFKAYNESRFSESILLFKKILEKQKDEVVLFYLGNAYLSDNKPAEAETTFKKYLAEYKEFEWECKWYLSLSYLKQGKENEATKLLEEVAAGDNDFSKKAKEILIK